VNLARVVGDVVATIKHEHLASQKLLLIQPVTPANEPTGRVAIAIDCAQAGPGDLVLVLDEGNGAAQVLKRGRCGIRTVIVGVVDSVESQDAV
jgi:ethanolamine utilization protein EutN